MQLFLLAVLYVHRMPSKQWSVNPTVPDMLGGGMLESVTKYQVMTHSTIWGEGVNDIMQKKAHDCVRRNDTSAIRLCLIEIGFKQHERASFTGDKRVPTVDAAFRHVL